MIEGCCQSGDCCREPAAIRMSLQEAALLQSKAMGRALTWRPAQPFGFVELVAHPCPFLDDQGCTVYDSRPYKCRQYLCFRATGETFDPTGQDLTNKLITIREVKRAYALNQRKAQRWGRTHGWRDDA